ncbi:MAG TPA: hypothetical protein VF331_09285 [Polyangiales bacterium]
MARKQNLALRAHGARRRRLRTGNRALRASVLLALCLCGGRLRADDAHVDATTTLQAYDVASPATSVVWTRRRLTQTLALRYVKPLEEAQHAAPPASVQAEVSLRLNQEFGQTCMVGDRLCFAVIDPARRASYTPIASNGLLDLPLAYVEARDLAYGSAVRLGRQYRYDAVGFTRIDGLSARTAPSPLLMFEAGFGTLVRRDSVAGSDAFVPDGPPQLALDAQERARAPYIQPDVATWVADASMHVGDERSLRASATYRTLLQSGGVIERRIGASAVSQPMEALRMSVHGVFDAIDPALVDADVTTRVRLRPWDGEIALERHVPRFDASSLWAYFDVAPTWLATLAAGRQITSGWDARLAVRGRRTELRAGADHDLGVEASSSLHDERDQLGVSGFGWAGGTGPLWGASAFGSHRMTSVVSLEGELSLMRIDDPLRSAMQGTSLYESLGAHFALTAESDCRVVLTHAHSGPIGERLSLLAFLHLGAWR